MPLVGGPVQRDPGLRTAIQRVRGEGCPAIPGDRETEPEHQVQNGRDRRLEGQVLQDGDPNQRDEDLRGQVTGIRAEDLAPYQRTRRLENQVPQHRDLEQPVGNRGKQDQIV